MFSTLLFPVVLLVLSPTLISGMPTDECSGTELCYDTSEKRCNACVSPPQPCQCSTCQPCPQPCASCPTCQPCPQPCVTCHTCQPCPQPPQPCPVCPTCPPCPPQPCTACPICSSCPLPCESCPKCPPCPTLRPPPEGETLPTFNPPHTSPITLVKPKKRNVVVSNPNLGSRSVPNILTTLLNGVRSAIPRGLPEKQRRHH